MGFDTIRATLRPIRDHVLVSDLEEEGIRLKSGIYIPSQDAKSAGIKPRWCKVYAIGPDQKDVKVGEWIYVSHGRWTRAIKLETENGDELVIRRVDSDDILLSSDIKPDDILIND